MQNVQYQELEYNAPHGETTRASALLSCGTTPTSQGVDRWAHQREEIAQKAFAPARALFWSPRTGKTRTIVGQLSELERAGRVKRTLVIAPQFVCKTVWPEELALGERYVTDLSSGPITKRKRTLRELIRQGDASSHVVLVNWDALSSLVEDLVCWKPQLVVADEAHYAKSAGAQRSRAYHRICASASYRRALTGTPTPRDYIDIYSIYKGLAPNIFGTSKAAFLRKYCELDPWGRPRFYRNLPELQAKIHSIASVFDRSREWHDLPPQVVTRHLVLPPSARQLYDDIVQKTVAEWEGIGVDATHKLARLVKLQELTAGFFLDDSGTPVWVHDTKISAAVSECVDLVEAKEKVVVFYHFTPEGRAIEERLSQELGADKVVRISGSTKIPDREVLQKAFLSSGPPYVMVMHDSLGVGISLRSASYLVRMSYPLDFAAFVQSNERIYEPGKPLTYITLEVERSVDAFARRVCMDKKRASDALLGLDLETIAFGRV